MGSVLSGFLLVEGGAVHSQANLVVLVDDLLNGVVYALTGYGEYADWSGTLSAPLMHFVGQLYMLLVPWGGVRVFPRDMAVC